MHRPMRVQRTIIKPISGAQCLSNIKIGVLHSPGSQVFAQRCDSPGSANLPLDSHIHIGVEILADQWTKQNVAALVSRQQCGLGPRPSHLEVKRAGDLARVQALLCEWSSLMNQTAGGRNPICKRAGIEIKKLPEQVLIQLNWRRGITPDGE